MLHKLYTWNVLIKVQFLLIYYLNSTVYHSPLSPEIPGPSFVLLLKLYKRGCRFHYKTELAGLPDRIKKRYS